MDFATHSELAGRHSFLAASKPAWVNYTEERFDEAVISDMAAQRGTQLHELAHDLVRLRVKLEDNGTTLSQYVNDAIGFRMSTEQILFYSYNAFVTTDAIAFRNSKLRVHDLKTGVNKTDHRQLEIYVAYFCLEYHINPAQIEIELRIYQNDDIEIWVPELETIVFIMDRIVTWDRRIETIREESARG